jgi:membrane protein
VRNALKQAASLIAGAVRHWSSDDGSSTGAALAFYCAFSLAPLLIILMTLAGWVVGANAAYAEIAAQMQSLFGPATAKILVEAMQTSQRSQGIFATVTSVVTLLIGATTVFTVLEGALDKIWRSEGLIPSGVVGWLRIRFLSLGFILALGFLLLVSLTISSALAGLRSQLEGSNQLLIGALGAIDSLGSLLLVTVLFALIYRYMPARRLGWKIVLAGGFVTALLFEVGRWGIGLYLAKSTQPSAFGAASSFAALLLWFYYTAQIFLFGAELTACLGGLRSLTAPEPATEQATAPEQYTAPPRAATPHPATAPNAAATQGSRTASSQAAAPEMHPSEPLHW